MESLPKSERVRALQTLGVWCQMELTGTEPPKSVLEGLNFNSIEAMRIQIANWGFPGWLTSQNNRRRKVKEGAGNKSELPPAVAAIHHFESAIERLQKAAGQLPLRKDYRQDGLVVSEQIRGLL
jgi:hypothetical protein